MNPITEPVRKILNESSLKKLRLGQKPAPLAKLSIIASESFNYSALGISLLNHTQNGSSLKCFQ